MPVHELRDPAQAKLFILQGIWLQRVQAPRAAGLGDILDWAQEVVAGGEPLFPIGLVADVGHIVWRQGSDTQPELPQVPGWPEGVSRAYEDYVLGKLYADGSFEQGSAALCQYRGRDQGRGLAFLLNQVRQRAGFGGVMLSPAILKGLRDQPAARVLAQGWESLNQSGPLPLLVEVYEELVTGVRQSGDVLGPEDVFELEHRTALAAFSQRLALRQVLQAAATLEGSLPNQRPRLARRRHAVPTRLVDEDTYPVGGFSSISTRGSIESLLHSQLAYMETERPDLFDIKFLRDELLYYSRDENQFLRRRRTFLFVLYPDLAHARFKDPELPWQRLVLLLGLCVAAVRKLIAWLSTDALVFEFIILDTKADTLGAEQAILEMIWREQIANGTVLIARMPANKLAAHCAQRARRSLCQCLTMATTETTIASDFAQVTGLVLGSCRPLLTGADQAEEDALGCWSRPLERLLREWL